MDQDAEVAARLVYTEIGRCPAGAAPSSAAGFSPLTPRQRVVQPSAAPKFEAAGR
jgi:hypothetical protein